jgi:glyoxylase-like metal-dependent hydrolase (beta-lactamase superfamily II)
MIKPPLCFWLSMLWFSHTCLASTPIAPDIDVVFGTFIPGEQPDGNSILIRAPDGLIVIDTGRHVQHTQQIIDFAQRANLPIRALINSHWHLDHIGGDARIRALYPDVQIYASDALHEALDGFLARYSKYLKNEIQESLNDPKTQASRDELAIIETARSAQATIVVSQTAPFTIAGRRLILHFESHAVTGGDVWVFDPATRLLAAGDLITLPVPFLDTACPEHWKDALAHLAASDFKLLVPGHGAPMHRREFERYRHAYEKVLECSKTSKSKDQCAAVWVRNVGNLLANEDRTYAAELMAGYVDSSLRAPRARIAKLCGE